ncbi:hypothetical protein EVG20_g8823 [Dentipellis fragilis]|uniref:Uncharacterized protein n=1 Tax=Dentipellis fragilis TaxID=205917 RepID=A0A4Y9Y7B6_9AGAM|nr:hypothetical protein EVG20_g8823 [Dentipellis fragilis]
MEFVVRIVPQDAVLCPDPNLHATASRRVTPPINKLPAEILEYIFLLNTQVAYEAQVRSYNPMSNLELSGPRHRKGFPDTNYPSSVPVSHVCCQWRSIALQYPELWTFISITLSPRWIAACFQRSSTRPLAIHMDVPIWYNHRNLLLTFKHNMQRLKYLFISKVTFEKSISPLVEAVSASEFFLIIDIIRERPAPILEFLLVEIPPARDGGQFVIPANIFRSNAPHLEKVSFGRNIIMEPSQVYSNLTNLRITAPASLQHLTQLIGMMPKLCELETGVIFCNPAEDAMQPTSLAIGPIQKLRMSAWRGTMTRLALFLCLLPDLKMLTIATDGSNWLLDTDDDAHLIEGPINLPRNFHLKATLASITDLYGLLSSISLPFPAYMEICARFTAHSYDDATIRRVASLAAEHLWICKPSPLPHMITITHLSISQVVQFFDLSASDAARPWHDHDAPSNSSFAPFKFACADPDPPLLAVRLLSALLPTMQIHTVSMSIPAPFYGESRIFSTPENGWTSALCSIPNLRQLKLSLGAVVPILQELLDRASATTTTNQNRTSQPALRVLLPRIEALAISWPQESRGMPECQGRIFSLLYPLLKFPVVKDNEAWLREIVLDRCGFFDSEVLKLGKYVHKMVLVGPAISNRSSVDVAKLP